MEKIALGGDSRFPQDTWKEIVKMVLLGAPGMAVDSMVTKLTHQPGIDIL
jgi:hypothetical protein